MQARLIAALVALLGWVASLAGSAWWAYGAGQDHEISKQSSVEKVRQETRDAAAEGAASVLSKLQPTQQTIIQKATHEIRQNTVFADCRSGPGLMRSANAIAAGASEPADSSKLPGPDTDR